MAFHNQKIPLSSHLIKLENDIRVNTETLTPNTIHETEERLHSVISQLSVIRSSRRFDIYRTPADVLYNIFTLAVYSSEHPDQTALAISRVCRLWRQLALEWRALWRFLNLSHSPSAVALFANQSKNTPLSLSCIWDYISGPTKEYFKSYAKLFIPRVYSLTLHASHSHETEIRRLFKDSRLPPLRLERLDFKLDYDRRVFRIYEGESSEVPDFIRVDASHLRELKIEGANLPWLQLPHNNLTHFKLRNPRNPPTLSQLLEFLSNCPLLCELEFGMGCHGVRNVSTHSTRDNALNFPNLKKLILTLENPTSSEFIYLSILAAYIRLSGTLSQFKLSYNDFIDNGDDLNHPFFNIIKPVPFGTFSHFRKHQYLSITCEQKSRSFRVYSAPSALRCDYPSSYPLILSGSWIPKTSLDKDSFLELIHAMPEITHLTLFHHAWLILTSWKFDGRRTFPCLHTLELSVHPSDSDLSSMLESLPESLRVKTLILTGIRVITFELKKLYDAVLRIGAETVELGIINFDDAGLSGVVAALRQNNIKVNVKWIY